MVAEHNAQNGEIGTIADYRVQARQGTSVAVSSVLLNNRNTYNQLQQTE
jgi:hypothetical protein